MELAAALGLILPAATDTAPVLTPLAASGLTVVMVLAAITPRPPQGTRGHRFQHRPADPGRPGGLGTLRPPQLLTSYLF
ncbi:DoxX family protein [Streptomyces sp. NBC_00280]|uniref:DoxX family protein n=1 Tax=Streptomyces sp. NBC_00280 TaxID=2975699 RepID=UPI00352EB7DE